MTNRHQENILQPSPSRVDFDQCPICLSAEQLTEEHVPPEAVGGRVMTTTCTRCNNELGSSIDSPFVDSMFGRMRAAVSTEDSNGVRGFRNHRNVRLAAGAGHELAVWVDGSKNSQSRELWEGASGFEMRMLPPEAKAVYLGELKSLYLACCVIAGEILSGETAERVRDDLVAVRDDRAEIATREVVDVCQWVRSVQPFDAEVTKPSPEPVRQLVIAREGRLIPAVGWLNYYCEEPFGDAPELVARFDAGVRFVEKNMTD